MSNTLAVPSAKSTRRLKRLLWRLLLFAAAIYLTLCAALYLEQDWIAFPGATDQGKAETQIHYTSDSQTVHLKTNNGIPITAVFGSAAHPHRPTILYFYGNAGTAAWSQNEFDHFRQLDCNVLIPDFAGYGASSGKASEANFYATADAAWNDLQTRSGVDPNKIIVVGWSLGAAVAIDVASRKPVAGLATFNAFTTMPAMAHSLFPWMPTGLLLKYRFDNQSKIGRTRCPVLICSAKLDTLVPPKMSDDLAAIAGGPVTRLTIATADHNSIFVAEPDVVWSAFDKWMRNIPATK